ncbi:MAG: response regulator [Leptospiraceae bacterium]|nr:response regulator [Leptospiraceae bacterium]
MNKVLCVDDDAITLMLCKTTIRKAGFSEEIITAFNGEEALEYYEELAQKSQTEYPQIIFLDLNMPVIGGWDFLDEFMESYYEKFNSTKVVILSSSVDPRDKERAKNYPIVIDFFSKPISKEILRQIEIKLNAR